MRTLEWIVAVLGLALLLLLVLPACSVLQPATSATAAAITRYCQEIPHGARLETRGAINRAAHPHQAQITCHGDPEASP